MTQSLPMPANTEPLPAAAAPPGVSGVPQNLPAARVVISLSAPVGIGVVSLLGWLIMHSFNLPYEAELTAAAIISLVAGVLAIVPMLIWIGKGAIAVVRLTMLAMLLRMALTFGGLLLAFGPGWHLDHGVLVLLSGACYFTVMLTESAATIWSTRH